jgi:chemotaxis response regulator CheB
MSSIVDIYGGSAAGIIMTGMGHDGGIGFKKLFDAGGYIISQDVESCVVAGMPKTIIDMDIANEILPLLEIADSITNLFRNKLKIL